MTEIVDFAAILLALGGGVALAVLSTRLTTWIPIPSPAVFLVVAAVVSDLFPRLYAEVPALTVERIAVVALIVILFNGGMDIGWRRFRGALGPILSLGVLGTFATAGIVAVFAHYVLGFEWMTAGVIGAALAPTDPAVMFSVLGQRAIAGRSGVTLEGEAGVNDPAGIALMIGMIELATHDDASRFVILREFAVEMTIGAAVGHRRCAGNGRAPAPLHPARAGPQSHPRTRPCRGALRRDGAGTRLRVPRRVHRGARRRGHPHSVHVRDRALPRRARRPRRDRGLRRPRPGRQDRLAHARHLGGRDRARARPCRSRAARRSSWPRSRPSTSAARSAPSSRGAGSREPSRSSWPRLRCSREWRKRRRSSTSSSSSSFFRWSARERRSPGSCVGSGYRCGRPPRQARRRRRAGGGGRARRRSWGRRGRAPRRSRCRTCTRSCRSRRRPPAVSPAPQRSQAVRISRAKALLG